MTVFRPPLRIAMVGAKGLPATHGGVERAVEEIGARLVGRGHCVMVVCRPDYSPSTLTQHRGMRLIHAPWVWRRKGADSLTAALSGLIRLARHSLGVIDLVHFHGLGVAPLIALARAFGWRSVITTHGLEWRNSQWSGWAREFFRFGEAVAMSADAVSAVGIIDRDDLAQRHQRDIHLMLNGVDLASSAFVNVSQPVAAPDFPYVLFVARLVPEKGPQHLIRAFNVAQLPHDAHLVIIGDAAGRPDFAASLRTLVAPDRRSRVHFLGFRYGAELTHWLAHARLFVLPSESEGLSLTLLEAMAYRVPVIASDIPQNVAVLRDDGRYFRSRDVASLATALCDAWGADHHAAVESAHRRVGREYSWDAVTDQVENLYRAALSS